MKKKILTAFCVLLIHISAVYATNWGAGNPFVDMMRTMLNMFQTMQLYQNFSGNSNLSTIPGQFSPGQFNYDPFAQFGNSRFQATRQPFNTPSLPPIDGLWASNTNTLLLIQGGYGQIYWSRTQYRNYYLRRTDNQLVFTDVKTGYSQTFNMIIQANQMILTDQNSKQQLFHKLSSEQFHPYKGQ